MLGIGLPVGAPGPYRATDPDAAAYASAMTVAPSAARVALIDTFVRAIKAGGLWTRLDLLYLLAAHDAQAARVNVMAPGLHTCSAVNSPSSWWTAASPATGRLPTCRRGSIRVSAAPASR
jgi:hypothetical protein